MQTPLEDEWMFLFSDVLNHGDVSNALKQSYHPAVLKPISAGKADVQNMQCWGESTTLKLKSRKEDDRLLQQTCKTY
jgi:hypothetical protein